VFNRHAAAKKAVSLKECSRHRAAAAAAGRPKPRTQSCAHRSHFPIASLLPPQALVDDGAFPYGAGARGDVTAAGGADYFSGRLENSPGYGTYVCYSKRLWGGQKPPADASSLRRFALAANDSVPAAGRVATIGEVAAWAADRLGIPAEQLVAEELSGAVAANDWVDDKGIRHVRLVQWSVDDDARWVGGDGGRAGRVKWSCEALGSDDSYRVLITGGGGGGGGWSQQSGCFRRALTTPPVDAPPTAASSWAPSWSTCTATSPSSSPVSRLDEISGG
jgi:hypothetical protein